MTSLDATFSADSAYRVLVGDNRQTLCDLPDRSVHMVATSPPYWGLRDYGHADQIGLEQSPAEYVATLVEVFREVRRVLRDDGTLWLNLGDSYFGGGYSNHDINGESWKERMNGDKRSSRQQDIKRNNPGLKPKDLVGIPWRVAFALQDDGWYLRQDIIWAKPNPMPESVQDRCTKAHEYVFLLTKSPRYYYDAEAVKEKADRAGDISGGGKKFSGNAEWRPAGSAKNNLDKFSAKEIPATRNRRSVWQIATAPCKEAHFATWPPKLVAPMILAGTSERGCCAACGAQWVRIVEKASRRKYEYLMIGIPGDSAGRGRRPGSMGVSPSVATGWRPSCNCGGEPVPCVVLDPFGGSGTTAGVANALGRKAILCELNPTYAEIVPRRVETVIATMRRKAKPTKKRRKPSKAQLNLFTA